jgi:hypothetical protein
MNYAAVRPTTTTSNLQGLRSRPILLPISFLAYVVSLLPTLTLAASFDNYHVSGTLGSGGAELAIWNNLNNEPTDPNYHAWTLAAGGDGSYTSSKPLPAPVDAPGDARYGDIAVNDILIQFQQAPVFPNGTVNSSGWVSIPPSGPVSPANVFAFHLQTEKNIDSTISNTGPSTSMRASGWWNFSGVSSTNPLYYVVEYRYRATVGGLPDGAYYYVNDYAYFPGGFRNGDKGPRLDPCLGAPNPWGFGAMTVYNGEYLANGTSAGQLSSGEFGWSFLPHAYFNNPGTITVVGDIRMAFSDTPFTSIPVAGGRFSNWSYSSSTGFSFSFSDGTIGQPYRIQSSTSLTDGSWTDFTNFTYTGSVVFNDVSSAGTTNRFYRAVTP